MISVGVVGATGYTGLELCRLLAEHPKLKVTSVYSQQAEGLRVGDKLPQLKFIKDLVFKRFSSSDLPSEDVVFYALPHGVTHQFLANAHTDDQLIIDLSADFRLSNPALYDEYYLYTHAQPEALSSWILGFSELNKQHISNARRIANPGCYSTAAVLGLSPLTCLDGAIANNSIINAISGVSGAGKALKETSLFCEVNENVMAYATGIHRHVPEIVETLGCDVLFSPHLAPMNRGILASIYIHLLKPLSQRELYSIFSQFYSKSVFVDVCSDNILISTKWVRGTNSALIFPKVLKNSQAVVFVVIDNLGKGAAGQAIQNANIALGFSENLGLHSLSISL